MLHGFLAVLAVAQSLTAGSHQGTPPDSLLVITHLDVGDGDATLIVTPDRRRILIDAGSSSADVARRLKQTGIDTIDLLIASHNHTDHIGGMPDVFARFVVLNFMDNGIPQTANAYQRMMTAAGREPGLQYLQASDRVVEVGSVSLRVLPPPSTDRSQNNNSVGILVMFGQFSALYTGDSERRQIGHWLEAGRIPRVTLVKAANHGDQNGATEALVRATSPQLVIFFVGAHNRSNLPSPTIMRWWTATSARLHRTDIDGNIEVTASRAGTFSVRTSGRP